MRSAEINKQTIWYSLYQGMADAVDSDGYLTGEKAKSYAAPVEFRINVSPNKGTASEEAFGVETTYDRVMNTCDMTCPIAEETLIWVGKSPADGPHNYRVTRVAPGLMNIVYAIKEVSIGTAQADSNP